MAINAPEVTSRDVILEPQQPVIYNHNTGQHFQEIFPSQNTSILQVPQHLANVQQNFVHEHEQQIHVNVQQNQENLVNQSFLGPPVIYFPQQSYLPSGFIGEYMKNLQKFQTPNVSNPVSPVLTTGQALASPTNYLLTPSPSISSVGSPQNISVPVSPSISSVGSPQNVSVQQNQENLVNQSFLGPPVIYFPQQCYLPSGFIGEYMKNLQKFQTPKVSSPVSPVLTTGQALTSPTNYLRTPSPSISSVGSPQNVSVPVSPSVVLPAESSQSLDEILEDIEFVCEMLENPPANNEQFINPPDAGLSPIYSETSFSEEDQQMEDLLDDLYFNL